MERRAFLKSSLAIALPVSQLLETKAASIQPVDMAGLIEAMEREFKRLHSARNLAPMKMICGVVFRDELVRQGFDVDAMIESGRLFVEGPKSWSYRVQG